MCGLCGVLGADDHWSDAAARPETFARRAGASDGSGPTPRQERQRRIALANRILQHYRLRLADFEGRSYVLRGATGRQEVVPHLALLWAAAERLAGRPCDPLDEALIAALERR
jgi:hypothetical protein